MMADTVAKVSIDLLKTFPSGCLPDKGKEWIVYSAIVEENSIDVDFKTVAAGTGTKCLSKSELNAEGVLLHDSHAEILAVRAFKRYLIDKLKSFMIGLESDLFEGSLKDDDLGIRLKGHIKYHFFTSHPPCGDATIFPVSKDNLDEPPRKKTKVLDDFSFTGAKLINQNQDEIDVLAQDAGAVRTKPGRGERTLSMSCSDKLAKLLILGVQGSFLSSFIKIPIYLETIVMARNSGYNRDSLERALYKRFDGNKSCLSDLKLQFKFPEIVESSIEFPFPKDDNKSPCPKSIIWCNVKDKPLEISVDGRRQGVAKRNIWKRSSRLKVSRIEMLREFSSLLKLTHPDQDFSSLSYKEIQSKMCQPYLSDWTTVKQLYFKNWTEKPEDLKTFRL